MYNNIYNYKYLFKHNKVCIYMKTIWEGKIYLKNNSGRF